MKISCIMPTANRRALLPLALHCFKNQTWPEHDRELVVVDDGQDCIEDLVRGIGNILYCRLKDSRSVDIGTKRNWCCQLAHGDVILHWDDDDWCAPTRITDQVERLEESGKQVSGYHSLFFWSVTLQKAFEYKGPPNYSCGTALCYRKAFWQSHPFSPLLYAEDNAFVEAAQRAKEISAAAGWQQIVARAHEGSSRPGRTGGSSIEIARESLPARFFEDLNGAL